MLDGNISDLPDIVNVKSLKDIEGKSIKKVNNIAVMNMSINGCIDGHCLHSYEPLTLSIC